MSKICPLCGGVAVWAGNNLLGEDVYECTICHEPGHYSRFKEDATVFHKITQSPEVLAGEFVESYTRWGEGGHLEILWRSNFRELSGMLFDTSEEAIAATVEKLKKDVNNDY